MTPAARLAAAISLLDAILAGAPAERALTNWGRASRFAGSGDRAALRDLVFDALRCRGSYAALGGGLSGRGLMLGMCRAEGLDAAALFTGAGHAPAPLCAAEAALLAVPVKPAEGSAAEGQPAEGFVLDWPDWLLATLRADLGARFEAVSRAMQARAPAFVRVNLRKTDRAAAQAALGAEGIVATPHPLAPTALMLGAGGRRLAQSRTYAEGLVELQDAASQAVLGLLPPLEAVRVLDYCAGGGGKALALAGLAPRARISAHDIDAGRMKDLGARAQRAGVQIAQLPPGRVSGVFDLVLVDAPCSGSGTWRRSPEAKWRLTPARLAELVALQGAILAQAAAHVAPGGRLLYMTCSLLDAENAAQVSDFLARRPEAEGWRCEDRRILTPCDGADGFFGALLARA